MATKRRKPEEIVVKLRQVEVLMGQLHDVGAENWADIASLIETCKLNAVDLHAWLARTLTAIAGGYP